MQGFRTVYELLRDTVTAFLEDECPRLGAALAFYITLSLAPMLLIVVGLAGIAFGDDAAREQVMTQIRQFVGQEGAQAVEATLSNSRSKTGGTVSTVIGFVSVLIGATGVFAQLQEALNLIWKVPAKPSQGFSVWGTIRKRLLSFSVLFGLGFLLLVSLALNAIVVGLQNVVGQGTVDVMGGIRVLDIVISLLLSTLLFAMIFKVLPQTYVAWRRVWFGAFVTACLFNVGKTLIGLYLGQTAPGSTFGAAGSVVVLLVWIYYSTQILMFGAEFTKIYSKRYGGMNFGDSIPPESAGPEALAHNVPGK